MERTGGMSLFLVLERKDGKLRMVTVAEESKELSYYQAAQTLELAALMKLAFPVT